MPDARDLALQRLQKFTTAAERKAAAGELFVEIRSAQQDDVSSRRLLAAAAALATALSVASPILAPQGPAYLPALTPVEFSISVAPDTAFSVSDRVAGSVVATGSLDEGVEAPSGLRAQYGDELQHPTQKVVVSVATGRKNGKFITESRVLESIHPADRIRLCIEAAKDAGLARVGRSWKDVYSFVTAETNWVPRDGLGYNGVTSKGLAQLEPSTAKGYGVTDANSPRQSVNAVALLIRDAASWTLSQRHADPSAALSVFYNTSTRLRNAWDGADIDGLPDPTKHHIANRVLGLREASSLEKKFAGLVNSLRSLSEGAQKALRDAVSGERQRRHHRSVQVPPHQAETVQRTPSSVVRLARVASPGAAGAAEPSASTQIQRRSVRVAPITVESIAASHRSWGAARAWLASAEAGRMCEPLASALPARMARPTPRDLPVLSDILTRPTDVGADAALLAMAQAARLQLAAAKPVGIRDQIADALAGTRAGAYFAQAGADMQAHFNRDKSVSRQSMG